MAVSVASLPLAPLNPLPYRRRLRALQAIHTGCEMLRDAGGPVTRFTLAPQFVLAPFVVTTSPQGAHDVLGRSYPVVDHDFPFMADQRRLTGGSMLSFPHREWLPRRRMLQPVFTRQHVDRFGGHMAAAANEIADSWPEAGVFDLAAEVRKLTMRVLCRSVLGLDLTERADALREPLRVIGNYLAQRARRPVRAPAWLPTPARHRAVRATRLFYGVSAEVLWACKADPDRDAPLVRAMLAARDPDTGQPLSDDDICRELSVFLAAGHDTTATALTFALWALGRHPDIQDRVAAEAAGIGDRPLTPADRPGLTYTTRVLNEALRLGGPTPAVMRRALKDVAVDGYRVTAGSTLIVGVYAMHRDPALWERPLRFDPDRFRPEHSTGRDRWQFIPFGAGPRSCIGDHFAMLEAALGLATIVRSHEIRSAADIFPMTAPSQLVPAGVIPVRARRR